MSSVDIVIGVVLLFGFYQGFKKGFLISIASLVGLLAGLYCAIFFSDITASYLSQWFNWNSRTLTIASFSLTFIAVVIGVVFIGKMLTKIIDLAALGIFNKILGGVFYVVLYACILSVTVLFLHRTGLHKWVLPKKFTEDAVLYTPVASIAPVLLPHLLEEVAHYKSNTEE